MKVGVYVVSSESMLEFIFEDVAVGVGLVLVLVALFVLGGEDGVLSIRNLSLNDVPLETPVECRWLVFVVPSAGMGVGGRGPRGGGKGAPFWSDDTGIGLRVDNREPDVRSYSSVSSGRGGRLFEGGGLLGAIIDNLKPLPAIDARFDFGLDRVAGEESTDNARSRSPGAGGRANVGAGRGGGGMDALWDPMLGLPTIWLVIE